MKKNLPVNSNLVALVLIATLLATVFAANKVVASQQRSTATKDSGVALNVPVSGSGGFNYTQGSYLEGFEFAANRQITVTKLGAYDSSLSKLPNGAATLVTVPVALYDITTNTLVREVRVSASSPATGIYRYATLARPVKLNRAHNYAVVWVSLSNDYIASPKLVASDVNPAIKYIAMVGYGPGGLTMTSVMVEPNWFYTKSVHGLAAINYDLGPNFKFTLSG
jgi:hypothetical protein